MLCARPVNEYGSLLPARSNALHRWQLITMNQLIAKTMANDGLCPLQYQTYQSNGTCLYSPRTPGYGTACTIRRRFRYRAMGGLAGVR